MEVRIIHKLGFGFLSLFALFFVKAQTVDQSREIVLKGSVVEEKNYAPISGVDVSTNRGVFTVTNGLGEFRIQTKVGDELIFQSPDFETVRYKILSDEDIRLVVKDYQGPTQERKTTRDASHAQLLDSANHYKKIDIEKSIDFIAQSISVLGKNPNKRLLAESLTNLGEIYVYHHPTRKQ